MRDGHNLENVLNDLPKCWKVAPLGLTSWVRARLGWKGLKAEEYVEEGIAFLSTPDIKNREINYQKVNRITHERYSESSEIALRDRKSTRLNSSHVSISYAVFCL